MSMNTIIDGLICSTVFTPGVAPLPCASAYMHNATGGVDPLVPDTTVAGQYLFTTPDQLDLQNISIEARAYNAAGDNRRVMVVSTQIINGGTQFEVFVNDDAGAASEDFVNCEVTVTRLPL